MQTTTNKAFQPKETTSIYELLFCDRPALYTASAKENAVYPWNVLSAETPTESELQGIASDPSLETRLQLLAYHLLRKNGFVPLAKELLGVVIEVGLEGGSDTLAAYKDGAARYINFTGKMIFWDAASTELNGIIGRLFASSQQVVNEIGPWDKERLPPPPTGSIRLNFLASDGLYFGQAPFEVFQKDPLAGPVVAAAMQLLNFLTKRG